MAYSEDLPALILNNPEPSQKLLGKLVPLIYKTLQPTGHCHGLSPGWITETLAGYLMLAAVKM